MRELERALGKATMKNEILEEAVEIAPLPVSLTPLPHAIRSASRRPAALSGRGESRVKLRTTSGHCASVQFYTELVATLSLHIRFCARNRYTTNGFRTDGEVFSLAQ